MYNQHMIIYTYHIYRFSDVADIHFLLNRYTTNEEVYEAIDNIYYDEHSTNIAHALELLRTRMFTRQAGDRRNVPNIGILITDGEAVVSSYNLLLGHTCSSTNSVLKSLNNCYTTYRYLIRQGYYRYITNILQLENLK